MKKILEQEQINRENNNKLIEAQKNKVFNYTHHDFEVKKVGNNWRWRMKGWKTWCMGDNRNCTFSTLTWELIDRYIAECKKPYGQRDLNFVHLTV